MTPPGSIDMESADEKRMSSRLERSGMEGSSHLELVLCRNRCEGPSTASAPAAPISLRMTGVLGGLGVRQ